MSPTTLKLSEAKTYVSAEACPEKEDEETHGPTNTTGNVQPGSITAWGSTTGKLYLSDSRLDDPKSRSVITTWILWGVYRGKRRPSKRGC
ncbi:hypothetical protein A1O1_00259 [Capronia coronata CBS 617.96]|uniref:Uncharacterized protein n=1 Tax=Capronia coronata CBS 617.96 TaxID=1182541 RepID=W9YZL9_9EURO|nr:uncharacterized protein A1O1_00259 [Capronia coronata CBS 617.96]EXJ95140.1 hypothetical protein A1O1_00259 [Capronia coronata CBS 617.96]